MKRIIALLSMLLLIASAQAWCPKPGCSQLQYEYTPPSSCVTYDSPCWDWLGMNGFYGQFLWWNMYGDQLDWAERRNTTSTVVGLVLDSQTGGTNYAHKCDFKPGFRLGFNHIFPCTENDLSLSWTYYWNDNSSSVDEVFTPAAPSIRLLSPYIAPLGVAFLSSLGNQEISSTLTFRLNRIDLTFGQNMPTCGGIVINYYGGAVFWNTDENLRVNGAFDFTNGAFLYSQENNISTSYRGAGAQVGLRLNWSLWDCLVFSANSTLAGTVGDYSLNQRNTFELNAPVLPGINRVTGTTIAPLSYWTTRLAASLGLSLRYSQCFCNQWVLYGDLGWEYHHYYNQTSFQVQSSEAIPTPTDMGFTFKRSPADLAVHGLTLTVGATF